MHEGYEAPISQALWKRVTTYGIPIRWFAVWIGCSILQVVCSMTQLGILWGLGIGVCVVALELFGMQWLTRQDMQWDELRAAHWARRYHQYYDAS